MKKMILQLAVLIPVMVFGQGVNKFRYDNEGRLHSSYTGEDNGNYKFVKYHENGQKASIGQFKNGEKHGVWKTWDSNGKLEAVAHYKNGEKTGKWIIKDEADHTTFEISFSHNHLLHALKKNDQGQIIAKR
jgi:antitoxin component YwqK of YwqJK toxin-antitoxin module